ncbi:MAG: hypothetical protein HYZ85_05395 [Candidatus Omnitrophica bacterium]|nr:hypothetical protein [Candidatus Omnitrophota bacterium]
MSFHDQELAERWKQMTLLEQMSNIGSEVDRALHWKTKNNGLFCQKAAARALELLDWSLASTQEFPSLKEIARVREALADYFFGSNEYQSSENSWRKYFLYFALAFRKNF